LRIFAVNLIGMGIAAAGAGVSAIGSVVQGIMGAKQASQARKAIDEYQRQELTNVYSGLSVSTLGADLQREELARATATGMGTLQQAGARALVGGIGGLQQGNVAQSRQIAADLDAQQKYIDQLRAQDNTRIQGLTEQREQQDLAGLGQMYNVGQQNLYGAIGGFGSSIANFSGDFGGFTPKTSAANTLNTQGIAPIGTPDFGINLPTTLGGFLNK